MRLPVFIFLWICFFYQEVNAQVVDMRAYSRQRGFKAYSVRQQAYVPPVRREAAQNRAEPATENTASPVDRPEHKIQQTGIKVFQEKDEDKVMNFNVENPEFDKLSDYKKQDLMKRISFKNNTD